jgi:hypothetical protein
MSSFSIGMVAMSDQSSEASRLSVRPLTEPDWDAEDKLEPRQGDVSARTMGGWILVDGCNPQVGDRILIVGSVKPEIGSENWHRLNGPEEHDKP